MRNPPRENDRGRAAGRHARVSGPDFGIDQEADDVLDEEFDFVDLVASLALEA
jgi:hypothetical protein